MVSKEEENFLRIVYLNYRVATGALRKFFDKLHPNLSVDLHIPVNKSILTQMYNPPRGRRRVLYSSQWNILYPPTGRRKQSSIIPVVFGFLVLNFKHIFINNHLLYQPLAAQGSN